MAPLISAARLVRLVMLMAASQTTSSVVASAPIGLPGCATRCGHVSVPYPFGMGPSRSSWPGFNLTCEACHDGTPRLHLVSGDNVVSGCVHVAEIHLRNATLRAFRMRPMYLNYTATDIAVAAGPEYSLSAGNELLFFGCDVEASLLGHVVIGGDNATADAETRIIASCVTNCSQVTSLSSRYCNGGTCCQAPITADSVPTRMVATRLHGLNSTAPPTSTLAYVSEEGWYDPFLKHDKAMTDMQPASPLLLRWAVKKDLAAAMAGGGGERCPGDVAGRLCKSEASDCRRESAGGYTCHCFSGYDGNPYITGGCQDINECDLPKVQSTCFGECKNLAGSYECRCPRGTHGNHPNGCVRSTTGISIGIGVGSGAGLILFILVAHFMARKIKNKREKMLKQKFFKQNRGQLLQQLVSQQADIAERMIITVDEFAKATNNFDKDRELGGGGHGTVYKGILSDLHVVAT